MKRKLLAVVLAALMLMFVLPMGVLAQDLTSRAAEARKLAYLDDAWDLIEKVEAELVAKKASPVEVTKAAYNAAVNDRRIDKGSLVWESDVQFAFTVDGMHCLYYYPARIGVDNRVTGEITVDGTRASNSAGHPDVLLVGPYYGVQSSFTDQYKEEALSIAETTGGSRTMLAGSAATGPAIVENYIDKGVVIYDSHGTQSGTSSYLCLTTNSGITSTDYNNGWAVSSGDAAYIDGRYVQNHVTGALSNCMVWMAICEGMKVDGYGTTGTALLAAGAGVVYGYSQSVTFAGDYEYEANFWTNMKENNVTVAEAFDTMTTELGQWDPSNSGSDKAWPIVMSPDDPFPANPDSHQTVNCNWTLLPTDPIALESCFIANSTGTEIDSASMPMGKHFSVKIVATPNNANNYTIAWATADTSVATVEGRNKTAVLTGVNEGTTTLTATVTTENKAVITKTIDVTVTEAPKWYPTDEIVPDEDYLIGFVVDGTTYLAVNYAPSQSNHYYLSVGSDYYGYTAPAIFSGEAIVGVSGYADDLDYCTWRFETETGGHIYSGYQDGYYLQAYSGTSYPDLHAGTDSNFTWTFDANAGTLYTYTSATRYAQYVNNNSNHLMGVTGSVPTNGTVQLYSVTDPGDITYYTVTFKDWDGTVLKTESVREGKAAHAPADPIRAGYRFVGWDVDFSAVMGDLVVTALYEEITIGDVAWAPTDTIVPGEDYLIGFVVDGVTYLMVNFNASASGNDQYYANVSYTYYGYTALADMLGEYVVGVSGAANDLQYCTWKFNSSSSGYTIQSGYQDSYYLVTWSSSSYDDLHPSNTSTNYYWQWNSTDKTLYRTIDSTNRYAQYYTVNGNNYMRVANSVPSNAYVQLFHEIEVEPVEPTVYTVTFVDWDGTPLSTQQVEEGEAAVAPANPSRIGYTFVGWDVDFSNVTSNLIVTAQYELNLYQLVICYQYEDGTEAAPTRYDLFYAYGEEYSVESPVIEGYTPDLAVVEGVMGNSTHRVYVTYYANEVPPTVLIGDVNCDGVVTATDISALFAYVMNAGSLSDQAIINADINGDGVVDATDASLLAQMVFGA